jgi:large subunit ribosomal protein L13
MQHVIDAKNKKLGRLATQVATILQGKHRATWKENASGEDVVVIQNAGHVVVSGRKSTQKVYYKHAGKLGHLKERTYEDIFAKNPSWVIRHAVNSMLPKNKLRAKRMRRLKFES